MICLGEIDAGDAELAGDTGKGFTALHGVPVQRAQIGRRGISEPGGQPVGGADRHLDLVIRILDGRRPTTELGIERLDLIDGRARPFGDAPQVDRTR